MLVLCVEVGEMETRWYHLTKKRAAYFLNLSLARIFDSFHKNFPVSRLLDKSFHMSNPPAALNEYGT